MPRLCLWMRIILAACFAMPVSHALAQREQLGIGDQPGFVPDPAEERLAPQFARQVVLYRTTEVPAPSSSIRPSGSSMSCSPTAARCATASGLGATAFNGR